MLHLKVKEKNDDVGSQTKTLVNAAANKSTLPTGVCVWGHLEIYNHLFWRTTLSPRALSTQVRSNIFILLYQQSKPLTDAWRRDPRADLKENSSLK